MKNVPWHGKVIVVTPVQCNRCFNVLQFVFRHRSIVMLEILLVASPIVAMETPGWFLLSIMKNCMSRSSSRSVMQNVWQKCSVHLGFVKTTENEENIGAKSLGDSFMTKESRKAVNEKIAGKELSNSHHAEDSVDYSINAKAGYPTKR